MAVLAARQKSSPISKIYLSFSHSALAVTCFHMLITWYKVDAQICLLAIFLQLRFLPFKRMFPRIFSVDIYIASWPVWIITYFSLMVTCYIQCLICIYTRMLFSVLYWCKFNNAALAAKRNRYQRQKSLMALELESQHAKGFIPTYNSNWQIFSRRVST